LSPRLGKGFAGIHLDEKRATHECAAVEPKGQLPIMANNGPVRSPAQGVKPSGCQSVRDNDDLSPRLWHDLRLLFLVDADIVCVLLSASGDAVSGQRNCLAVPGELTVPMNGDRSTPAGILLDRVLIDAFDRKFPGPPGLLRNCPLWFNIGSNWSRHS